MVLKSLCKKKTQKTESFVYWNAVENSVTLCFVVNIQGKTVTFSAYFVYVIDKYLLKLLTTRVLLLPAVLFSFNSSGKLINPQKYKISGHKNKSKASQKIIKLNLKKVF